MRIPFADTVLYKIHSEITDEQALMLSDIVPTGYFGADMAQIKPGESVAVYGAGPVGQMAIKSAWLMGASKVFAIDSVTRRLEMARDYGCAEIIDYSATDPIKEIMNLTDNNGVDKAIEAVGL